MSIDRPQRLRVLEGRFTLERATDTAEVAAEAEVLALVFGPDRRTTVRRDDTADNAWVALWNGDEPHDPQATGASTAIQVLVGGLWLLFAYLVGLATWRNRRKREERETSR